MKALVVNDDGVRAEGIKILVQKLLPYAESIVVVAPSTEKSAASQSLTIRKPITLEILPDIIPGIKTYAIDANPADCVIFASRALKIDFDTVFSGINRGYNVGNDIMYSGTVAAATEAVMHGYRGIAVSCKYDSFEGSQYFDEVMQYLLNSELWNTKTVINVNMPKTSMGIKITHQAVSTYESYYVKNSDGTYGMACDTDIPLDDEINGDIQTIKAGYISITPLTINRTDLKLYNKYH